VWGEQPLISFQSKASEKIEESSNKVNLKLVISDAVTGRTVTLDKDYLSPVPFFFKINPRDLVSLVLKHKKN